MGMISKQLDKNLARLAWSLWTELGVAGLERKHQVFAVTPEELIILTSALSEFDPRLRDEGLDWCIRYYHLISSTRLQFLAKKYEDYIAELFSIFSITFNSTADIRTKWIVLRKALSLKFRPSGKSVLRDFEVPSMVHFRLRSFLGVSARADILAFFLGEKYGNYTASDLRETGYSKRHLAQILADLAAAGILSQSRVRNQLRYAFAKRVQFINFLGDIPKKMIYWDQILAVILPIRACLQSVEDAPIGVRVINIRNLLNKLSDQFLQLKITPPSLQNDFEAYWNNVTKWILDFSATLAQGDFKI